MNLRERYLELTKFLKPYQELWQNEILLMYPAPLKGYPEDWINELNRFKTREDLIRLERKDVTGLVQNPSLLAFYARIEELRQLPRSPEVDPMPEDAFTFLYMVPKKQHEVKKLSPLIHQQCQDNGINQVIDIGGGVGLLAQTLVNQYQLNVSSLDLDPVLQETGRKRHERYAKGELRVKFQNIKVTSNAPPFLETLNARPMTVGLHTCGTLAIDQIKASSDKKIPSLINLGCCYHRLSNNPQEQKISQFAQVQEGLILSPYALTLSSRAHYKMHGKDFDFKIKVKLFRYTLHFLLHDEYGIPDFLSVGNSHPRLYEESFGTYALEQFARINVSPHHSREELDTYFDHERRKELISRMLAAGLLRDAFGRLLEIYLLLDRAIYLEERGYKVDLWECFDQTISPRNIGIFARLK